MSFGPSASPVGEAARRIANAVGVALGSEGPFRVRLYPAQVEGDVPWASVELWPAGALAVVWGDSSIAVVDGRLVGFQKEARLVDAAVASARGGVRVNALELLCDALPYIAARVAVAGSWWRASFWGIWENPSPTGASIDLGGDEWGNLVALTQAGDGVVEVRRALGLHPPVRVTERAALPALYQELAADVQRAFDARAAFRARPFSLRTVGQRLLGELRQKRWQLRVRENFPGASSADLWHRDDVGEHFEAILEERDGVVTVAGRALRSAAELEAALPELVAEIRMQAARLRADHLRPGARYRVLRPFKGLAVGQTVTFAAVEHYPRDFGSAWKFGGGLELSDQSDGDLQILGALHQYLALDLPR